ncbi:MAG: hypothetical protein WAR83_09690 [Flavobacteriales bacterium]|nr:hypothetical protein [Flavobacteriales bacterium]
MRRAYLFSLVLMMIGFLTGCYYDVEEELYPNKFCVVGDATMANYYTEQVAPIIETRCAIPGCHVAGGSAPGNFLQYTEVKARVDDGKIQLLVFDQRSMPPSGVLPSCDILKLQAWVAAGAPN